MWGEIREKEKIFAGKIKEDEGMCDEGQGKWCKKGQRENVGQKSK